MFDGDGKEQKRNAHLNRAEIQQDQPVRDRPRFFKDEWNADDGCKNICGKNAFGWHAILLSAHRYDH